VSANPAGMSKAARELYLEARELAHRVGPGAIRRLAELASVPLLWTGSIDPRVIVMAASNLCERAYGRAEAYDPNKDPSNGSRLDVRRLSPEQREQLRQILEAAMGSPPAVRVVEETPVEPWRVTVRPAPIHLES
jgi:hypothetical protein